jgi:hypothetical protein
MESLDDFMNHMFPPVKDKPGYVWVNKRSCEIAKEDIVKEKVKSLYPQYLILQGEWKTMVFSQTNYTEDPSLRDLFCNAVIKVFGDSMSFIDILENDKYSSKYDCFLNYDGENYIINRDTGEYINWYKLYHIGRSICISTTASYKDVPEWIEKFLVEFKGSEGKE